MNQKINKNKIILKIIIHEIELLKFMKINNLLTNKIILQQQINLKIK